MECFHTMVEASPHLVSLAFSSQSNDTKAGQRLMGDSRARDCQGQDARPQRRSWLARRENMWGGGTGRTRKRKVFLSLPLP